MPSVVKCSTPLSQRLDHGHLQGDKSYRVLRPVGRCGRAIALAIVGVQLRRVDDGWGRRDSRDKNIEDADDHSARTQAQVLSMRTCSRATAGLKKT